MQSGRGRDTERDEHVCVCTRVCARAHLVKTCVKSLVLSCRRRERNEMASYGSAWQNKLEGSFSHFALSVWSARNLDSSGAAF